jgi:hypothetical protein
MMSSPVLALVPVLPTSTGAGANAGSARQMSHRHHALRENTAGKQESGEVGRFAGPLEGPGAPRFPFSSCYPAARHQVPRSRV